MGQFHRLLGSGGNGCGVVAAFGLFAAHVYLQKNVLHNSQFFRLLFNLLQQRVGAHRLNQRRLSHHLAHLVALQMADEVERRAVIGVFSQLSRHLLHPVFSQRVDTGGDRLPAGGGVIHFTGPDQRNLRRITACGFGRRRDFSAHPRDIFFNRHKSLPFSSPRN